MPFVIDDLLIALAIAGGSAALKGGADAIGASNASSAQNAAGERALEFQREAFRQQQANYNQQREDQAPWLEAGRSSLGELLRQMQGGQFETPYQRFDGSMLATDPGYQFRMAEGQKALERSASARGMLNSGGALKSLSRYSQGLASDEFQNAFGRHQADYATRAGQNMDRYNRLAGMAGVGQAAAQNLGSLGANFNNTIGQNANQVGSIYGAMGNAEAAGHMATANAFGNFANTVGGIGAYGMLGNQQQSIPSQTPYGYSTMGYPSQGFGPWR